jgi:GNAT superfamily N-acetyltransferase
MSTAFAREALRDSISLATERDADGRLIGLARAIGDGFYVVVVDVMVHPDEQENGVGHRVMKTLLEDPRVADAGHLALFAAPDAVELYESFGFREENGVYMRRP